MKIAAVIPARYDSKRFAGKPLVSIAGMSMIERVYRQVEKANRFTTSQIIVATDDDRIANEVKQFGGRVQLTSKDHKSGTDRIWEVIENNNFDAIINIQGDEPLISDKLISEIYKHLEGGLADIITAAYFNKSYQDFISENTVKVVFDKNHNALYFSRSPLPFHKKKHFKGFFHHIGIYGYLKNILGLFVKLPPSNLEALEKLEQLRFLENNLNLHVLESDYKSLAVDEPQDVKRVEDFLKDRDG